MGNAAGELDDLETTLKLTFRIGEYLPVLTGDNPRELVGVPFNELPEPKEHARSLEG